MSMFSSFFDLSLSLYCLSLLFDDLSLLDDLSSLFDDLSLLDDLSLSDDLSLLLDGLSPKYKYYIKKENIINKKLICHLFLKNPYIYNFIKKLL